MIQEEITVEEGTSERTNLGLLIIGARRTTSNVVDLVIGRPGLPNVIQDAARLGDAFLFETPDLGIFEVRVMSTDSLSATFLISQVSPRTGIAGGFVDQDPSNTPFTPSELEQIASSLEEIRQKMSLLGDLTSEQLDHVVRKLDEMRSAAERLGRKDWMAYVAGTLTSIIVNAAIDRDVGRALFEVAGTAFSWLFNGALKLIS